MLKDFVLINKKNYNGEIFYLLSDYNDCFVMSEKDLKVKLKDGEMTFLNLFLDSEELKIDNSHSKSEENIFLETLVKKIECDWKNYREIFKYILKKLSEITNRKILFGEENKIFLKCVKFLEIFFQDMKQVDSLYTLSELDILEELGYKKIDFFMQSNYILDSFINQPAYLGEYIKNGILKSWYFDYKNNVDTTINLIECLKIVYKERMLKEKNRRISIILKILDKFFNSLEISIVGEILYSVYIENLFTYCTGVLVKEKELKNNLMDLSEELKILYISSTLKKVKTVYLDRKNNILNKVKQINKYMKYFDKSSLFTFEFLLQLYLMDSGFCISGCSIDEIIKKICLFTCKVYTDSIFQYFENPIKYDLLNKNCATEAKKLDESVYLLHIFLELNYLINSQKYSNVSLNFLLGLSLFDEVSLQLEKLVELKLSLSAVTFYKLVLSLTTDIKIILESFVELELLRQEKFSNLLSHALAIKSDKKFKLQRIILKEEYIQYFNDLNIYFKDKKIEYEYKIQGYSLLICYVSTILIIKKYLKLEVFKNKNIDIKSLFFTLFIINFNAFISEYSKLSKIEVENVKECLNADFNLKFKVISDFNKYI